MPFQFRLELPDGEPADPPTFATGVSGWRPGDTLVAGPNRTAATGCSRFATRRMTKNPAS